jgi:hypothetical protein
LDGSSGAILEGRARLDTDTHNYHVSHKEGEFLRAGKRSVGDASGR